ncbi:DNA polymerase III, delta prime subunit [Nitrosomonas sp. PY1]|uniref:DNA polymerase III subunit delta' n=1 Tax=Nitrosomonas sp. PY1 TaxID=1803906 RepID=UPI001FC853E7|nr:DNA polymerase III subunit delta' [Nitrosomonas sp. PY1]GKS69389.1 DNA polymerase III, delta prime subunit [Nitrosomonas sp. PY1]
MFELYPWQQEIWQILLKNQQYWRHALLLTGKRGIGKYTFSRQLAKSLLCHSTTTEHIACGACLSCRWFEQGGHPNLHCVIPEALSTDTIAIADQENKGSSSLSKSKKNLSQQISIDQIRYLNDFIYLTSHQKEYKVVLIYPAETMTHAAANALLKKLEEPPANVLFILVTHQIQRLLPTIRSRCQQVVMPAPSTEVSIAWLKQHSINDSELILPLNDFSPLLTWSFVREQLTVPHQYFVDSIKQGQNFDPFALALSLQQIHLSTVVGWLQKWCYDLVSYRVTGRVRYYLKLLPAIQILSKQVDLIAYTAFLRELSTHQKLSYHPLNARLFLEEMFIRYSVMLCSK